MELRRLIEAYRWQRGLGHDIIATPYGGDYTKVTYLHGKGERIANVTRQVGS